MAQAVTVYRWDDVGAPQASEGRPAEFMTVLKKCLVEGYGTKASAGWSIAHESAPEESPYIALRNNAIEGSGGVLMVKASNNNLNTTGRFQAAGDFISDTEQSRLGAYFYGYLFGNSSGYPNNWIIVATSTAFYFLSHSDSTANNNYHGTYNHTCFFAGDFISFYSNDQSKFITLSGLKNSSSAGWNSQLNYLLGDNPTTSTGDVYALDGSESKSNAYLTTCFGLPNVSNSSIQDSEPPIRVLSPYFFVSGSYNLASAGGQGNSQLLPFVRGRIPGLFGSQESGYRNKSMAFSKLIDGVNHMSIAKANNGGTNFWINLEEWA